LDFGFWIADGIPIQNRKSKIQNETVNWLPCR
jgi:hypothetical protein